jgi:hypothetical protein
MLPRSRAGVAWGAPASFAPATERVLGNQLPAWTGSPGDTPDVPGPHPSTQPMGGRTGKYDGSSGADPWRGKRQPNPRFIAPVIEGQASGGAGPALGGGRAASEIHPLGYGQGASNAAPDGISSNSFAARLAAPAREQMVAPGRQSWWRGGIQGFNDQLQVRDRHAYWSTGKQRFRGSPYEGSQMSGRNPQLDGPPMATLETVNISVNPQIGSDHTSFADDLSRPYTWLGQQDGTVQRVSGGVPGLVIPYGSRGGVPYPIVDPSNGEGGPKLVRSGPPHGLHSNSIPDGKQLQDRYKATPQMRPVRLDRPANSTMAGQSYSQTVQRQGDTGPSQGRNGGPGIGLNFSLSGGWRGSGG